MGGKEVFRGSFKLNQGDRTDTYTKVSANAQFGKEFCLADER